MIQFGVIMLSNDFLKDTFLFRGMDKAELDRLILESAPQIVSYKRGDLVYSSADDSKVGFILNGMCEIRRTKSDGSRTVLNVISEKDSFGILSVFSGEDFPTQIFALRNCDILYFTEEQIKQFVNNNLQISQNLINFLVSRVNLLNKKIATFSGTRVEDRLAAFLLYQADVYASLSFPINYLKTAEEINAGRASVYRALAALEESGLIKIDNKKIYITDLKGLERITK